MKNMDKDLCKSLIAEFLGEGFTETQVDNAYEYAENLLGSLIDAHQSFANVFGTNFKFKQMEVAIIISLYYFIYLVTPEGGFSGFLKAFDLSFSRVWECLIDAAIDSEKIDIEPAQKPKY